MNVLVTGVAGFIGSNFLDNYIKDHPENMIIGLDQLTYAGNIDNIFEFMDEDGFEFIKGDISDIDLISSIFDQHDIDRVVNFAAESHVDRSITDPQVFMRTNILGTHVLLECAKSEWYDTNSRTWDEGKRFLQVSTDEVYGALGPEGFFTERTTLDPHSPYSASKASADLIVMSYHDTYGMPVNITRCSNNYGPYQFPEKLIPLMIKNALDHNPLPIYGDGKQVRDWLYVKDHCKAIDIVMENAKVGEVYNIGGHNEMENINIVTKIIDILRDRTGDEKISNDLITHVDDRLGHDRRYAIDPTKIHEELSWEPSTMFEEGIIRTVDWYLENREWIRRIETGEYMDHKWSS